MRTERGHHMFLALRAFKAYSGSYIDWGETCKTTLVSNTQYVGRWQTVRVLSGRELKD